MSVPSSANEPAVVVLPTVGHGEHDLGIDPTSRRPPLEVEKVPARFEILFSTPKDGYGLDRLSLSKIDSLTTLMGRRQRLSRRLGSQTLLTLAIHFTRPT